MCIERSHAGAALRRGAMYSAHALTIKAGTDTLHPSGVQPERVHGTIHIALLRRARGLDISAHEVGDSVEPRASPRALGCIEIESQARAVGDSSFAYRTRWTKARSRELRSPLSPAVRASTSTGHLSQGSQTHPGLYAFAPLRGALEFGQNPVKYQHTSRDFCRSSR